MTLLRVGRSVVLSLAVACCISMLASAAMPATARADDWPQWMGPNRDAIWHESGIVREFPADGPAVKWRISIGTGYAGPAVADGRVYLMDRKQELDADGQPVINRDVRPPAFLGTERVLCVSAETGELIWEHEYDCPYQIQYQNGPRTTCLIENGRCYALGAMGDLFCFNAENGEILWQKSFTEQYGAKAPLWGWSNHPMIHGDRLFCTVGGEGSAVVAFDKNTGEELWKTLTVEEIGYAPPVIYEADGKQQLIAWLDTSVESLDPATGKSLWSTPFPENAEPQRPVVTIMTPFFIGSHLYVSNFYNGSLMWDVAADFEVPIVVPFLSGPNPREMEHVRTDPVVTMLEFFDARLRDADRFGARDRCILDPGTGFAPPEWPWEQRFVYQREVYTRLDELRTFGLPIYIAMPWKETPQHDELLEIVVRRRPEFGRVHYPAKVRRFEAAAAEVRDGAGHGE